MIAGFIIGFVGSLHCIGMCGPLTLFVMGKHKSPRTFLSYHGGRMMSYVLIGSILEFIGYSLQLFKVQQIVTFFLGAALIFLYGIPGAKHRIERLYYHSSFNRFIRQRLLTAIPKKNQWVLSGMINGFLPCGLTYVATTSAIAVGGGGEGVLLMLSFGLGTIPALLMVAIGGAWTSHKLKRIIPRAVTFVAISSGCLLIVRGLWISPLDFKQIIQSKSADLITICSF